MKQWNSCQLHITKTPRFILCFLTSNIMLRNSVSYFRVIIGLFQTIGIPSDTAEFDWRLLKSSNRWLCSWQNFFSKASFLNYPLPKWSLATLCWLSSAYYTCTKEYRNTKRWQLQFNFLFTKFYLLKMWSKRFFLNNKFAVKRYLKK